MTNNNRTLTVCFVLSYLFLPCLLYSQTVTLKTVWVKKASVYTLAFTPNAEKLVTGGIRSDNNSFGQINVWRVKDSTLLQTLTNGNMGVTNDVDVSKEGNTILSGNGSVECGGGGEGSCGAVLPGMFTYSINGKLQKFLNDSNNLIHAAVYSPDNTVIAAGTFYNNTGNIRIYDSSFHLLRILQNHADESGSLSFTPNGKYLVSGNDSGDYGSVKLWDYKTGLLVREMTNGDYINGGGATPEIAVSPDGKYIAGGGQGYNMATRIWRVSDGKLIYTLPIQTGDYYGNNIPKFSPDGNYIVSGVALYSSGIGWHGLIYIWRVQDGALLQTITDNYGAPQSGGILALAFSPGKNYFAYSVYDELKLFSYSTGNLAIANKPENISQVGNPAFPTTVYPNPLSTSATIRYHLTARQNVSLSVYDMQGKKVKNLVSGEKEAGTYRVLFTAANLSPGIYVYKLITGNNVETGKLLIKDK